jgi:hypothetical protein
LVSSLQAGILFLKICEYFLPPSEVIIIHKHPPIWSCITHVVEEVSLNDQKKQKSWMFCLNSSAWKRAEWYWLPSTPILYFGGPMFETQQSGELSWQRIFHGFLHSLQEKTRIIH